ncbi:DUF4349 domain-containing protein [Leucobacter insecticola]|uniref:DUF4349 domain-containing protein n=1 Tax=Leucobacter insecticola TaxID=2714934 RepID=A0A6G8FIU7_9MICO|nr:DUF4349 domain-containing protein [Leucobacter insecticola]QIM16271.1 DUF4349 domain-containing protein [Leucobacter insecticola]
MKRRRSLLSAIAALAAVLVVAPLSACAAGQSDLTTIGPQAIPDTQSGAPESLSEDSFRAADPDSTGPSIIYSGDISLTVSDPGDSAARVETIIKDLGGYVESQTVDGSIGGSPAHASMAVRVPADKFDAAFEQLAEIGDVVSQSRSSADVTTQRVDLQARVGALEESVSRLKQLMTGAASTSELIEAESALSQRQQELDGLRAQLEILEDQVDDASIWVNLSTQSVIPGGPASFWEGLLAGFASLGTAGAGALVLAGILIPWVILGGIIAGGIVLIVRVSKKRRQRRQGSAQEPQLIQ